jgi:methionyl-tRNA formyltransferase
MGLTVYQPERFRSEESQERMANASPDVLVVVAFGRILPASLLEVPPLGAINVHASLLPRWRGAAPIQWAVAEGDKETGVTTMQMGAGLDTGDILLQRRTAIGPAETAGMLHDRLADMAAPLLVETLQKAREGRLSPRPQDDSRATTAPQLKKEDGRIDWSRSARRLEAFVRGMTPWPGAFTFHGGLRLKIFSCRPEAMTESALPGTVVWSDGGVLQVATGDGALTVLEIQAASGRRMTVAAFLQGYRLPVGTVLG